MFATSTNGPRVGGRKVPDGKFILPGVVSHATNVVEHPDLVAERIYGSPSCRPRARYRGDRLRAGRPGSPAGRLGEARGARAGRGACEQTALAVIARWANPAHRSAPSGA